MAYFLPKWITNHDVATGRSAERYKSAMKLVSEAEPTDASPVKKKRNIVATRRTIFSMLAAVLLISIILISLGILPLLTVFIPLSAIAIYQVSVRRQILAAQVKARRLKAFEQITSARITVDPTARISLARESNSENENWIPLAERLNSACVVVIPQERKSWQPIQVPKPTYSTAPKAITSKRVIDLTVPGAWITEANKSDSPANLHNSLFANRDDIFDQELSEQAAVVYSEESFEEGFVILAVESQNRAVND